MLLNLHVKNLALIDECEVDFDEGLNILTGETGAGKSIIIGSISLALGAKVSKEIIRENSEYALIELIFQLDTKRQKELIKELGIDVAEDGQIIISRKLMNARSISKINGETVTVGTVKEAAEILLDIHGQHEHQSLLYKKNHLSILDEFARQKLLQVKEEVAKAFHTYEKLNKQLKEYELDEEQKAREISFAEFEVNEIENAGLKIDEDIELEKLHKRMSNSKKIVEGVSDIYALTGYDGIQSAGEFIGKALKELSSLVDYDKKLKDLCGQLRDIDSLLNDFNRETSDYMSELEFSDEEFEETENRLDLINNLKAKYGKSIEEILQYKEKQENRLLQLTEYEQFKAELKQEIQIAENNLKVCSEKMSLIRKKSAKELALRIKDNLVELNFLNVEFEIEFIKLNHYTQNGFDEIEFMISTNPGEPIKPLGKIASGGELSRIMLAIKTVLSDKDETGTLIFDEIDVGISGRTAQRVSEKMALIAQSHQVLCITHLPQIAAMADTHFMIEKIVNKNKTITSIRKLNKKEIIMELARILGGAKITETVIQSAKEMKELATRTKNA
ncbi:DNA replication and repair protein RecN [Lachnotalea glycerini]|uniref:DNA repair protein RecN n=1 Tax=Lachnotalea glycerini TaxID=1763509 RepID=A0A255I8B4_9FIRM|nr:DNA repair protein RecN [Lachnotalea glycerini]PXV93569.1 DNA replication and repair protein RecN [Lachnotalea glycerini]RDY32527.1 DNA repair protein RecN [Lachnotalea glycerini]